jgi:hypothetical protein
MTHFEKYMEAVDRKAFANVKWDRKPSRLSEVEQTVSASGSLREALNKLNIYEPYDLYEMTGPNKTKFSISKDFDGGGLARGETIFILDAGDDKYYLCNTEGNNYIKYIAKLDGFEEA